MKKAFTVVLMLTFCLAMSGVAGTQWQFVKVFPDTTISFGTGVHGIAVDKANKIGWPAGRTNLDSLSTGRAVSDLCTIPDFGTERLQISPASRS